MSGDPIGTRGQDAQAASRAACNTIRNSTVRVGSRVQFFRNGFYLQAVVTTVYPKLSPVRWEGELAVTDTTQDLYPNEGDRKIWAFEEDIVAVVKH